MTVNHGLVQIIVEVLLVSLEKTFGHCSLGIRATVTGVQLKASITTGNSQCASDGIVNHLQYSPMMSRELQTAVFHVSSSMSYRKVWLVVSATDRDLRVW